MIGAEAATGPTVSQACATSARAVASAAQELEGQARECLLVVTCDRTSNGPHVYFPDPAGRGGTGEAEDPVWDSFNLDPHAGGAMIQTAENVARQAGISREEQDAIALLRHEQYLAALANDREFQRRYVRPVEIVRGKKVTGVVEADEGITPKTREGLAGLKPVLDGGTVTSGTQTHPADGNAGVVLTTRERARQLSRDRNVTVQLLAHGEARVGKGLMPMAPVPAARAALSRAGLRLSDCKAVKTHNPFAVNDAYFCRETGIAPEKMNRYGSPLVYGHPQAPTGLRAFIELIEELVAEGGGTGLFTGCAAGDSAMALVVRVT
jgi:acetyl-CoA acetyltransferase